MTSDYDKALDQLIDRKLQPILDDLALIKQYLGITAALPARTQDKLRAEGAHEMAITLFGDLYSLLEAEYRPTDITGEHDGDISFAYPNLRLSCYITKEEDDGGIDWVFEVISHAPIRQRFLFDTAQAASEAIVSINKIRT